MYLPHDDHGIQTGLAEMERVNFIAEDGLELFLCAHLNPNECTLNNTTTECSGTGGRLATRVPVSYESRWTYSSLSDSM